MSGIIAVFRRLPTFGVFKPVSSLVGQLWYNVFEGEIFG